MFQKKSPVEQEWDKLCKKEIRFIKRRMEEKESSLNRKLEGKVPDKLQNTLDTAFVQAFKLIFEKGTGIIEKTYRKDELKKNYQVNEYADEIKQSKKSLKAFSKKAEGSGLKNLMLSGTAGIGMGVLGIGIPDIPLFTGMLLKSIYEIALNYGYEYESEKERYFILLLIQSAVSHGDLMLELDQRINEYIDGKIIAEAYDSQTLLKDTASALSKELLYMKFLQGIPVVGVVGGAYDAVYMKQITEYANIKYKRRFIARKSKK